MEELKYIMLFVILLSSGCRNEPVKTAEEEIAKVKVIKAVPENIGIPVHASGILSSEEEMKLSFKTGGIVEGVRVKEGDRVKRGAILASLNLSEINAQVNLARNGYDKALRDRNRVKSLYTDTVATLEQLQNAETALNLAKSNLDITLFNLEHSLIRAPGDGVILKQLVNQHELVAPGYPVFLFGITGEKWVVRSALSDRDIIRINPGDSAAVTFDAYAGIIFSAVVERISEMSNPMTGTYQTELNLDGKGYRLASGFIAGVEIFPSQRESLVMIPVGAIVEADGRRGHIFYVTDSGTVKKSEVGIETLKGSEAAVKGIPPGVSEIVSEGAAYLRDGERVRIVR
jgi:RND family efflux transporter MFP subunit